MIKANTLIEPLTRRELEILALLAQHYTNKEIASSLSLSVNSVKWYARQIYGKLGIENRQQAVERAIELDLLTSVLGDVKPSSISTSTRISLITTLAKKPRHNLPLQLTSFVGRGSEIQQVKSLLGTSRLVTLTGAGGVGKTRLALAVASQMLDQFKDGLWLVELAPMGDPALIPGVIASIFGVHADQNRSLRKALLDYLLEKQLLLILDNCEHLIDACAEIADTILRACPRVCLLASSREALGIEGEVPFLVPSMSFPELGKQLAIESLESYEAIQLFQARARLVLPGFTITTANASSLAQLCHRLDGIPLALELAAARLQVLSLEQIVARLDDSFRLLTGGNRRALPRHQTLHALIGWSYELLNITERTLFRRLSVFAGGWSLEAAEAVCTDENLPISPQAEWMALGISSTEILELLGGLVNKSLVAVERSGDTVPSYRMLETIRQYAQEKLVEAGEAERFRDRHLDYFLRLAEQSEPLLRGSEVLACLNLLDDQIDNLRLALSWAFGSRHSTRVAKGLRLATALKFYWYTRSLLDEGSDCLKSGIEIIDQEDGCQSQIRAKALSAIGLLVLNTLDFTRIAQVRPLLEKSISLFQECNDRLGQAVAQCELGLTLVSKYYTSGSSQEREEYPVARALGEQSLAACRQLGNSHDLAFALLVNLFIYSTGEVDQARIFGEEALVLCEKNGDKLVMEMVLMRLADLSLTHDMKSSLKYIQKALHLAQELEDKNGIINIFIDLGLVAYYSQDFEAMESHFQISLDLSRETGGLIYQMFSLRNLGIAALRQGKLNRSKEYFLENLSRAQKVIGADSEWAKYDLYNFILGMAGIALETGQPALAARMLGVVEAQLETFFKPLDPWDQAEFNRITGDIRHLLDAATFAVAWSAGRGLSLEQAITEVCQISL
jgi:predicted ATPase/DNA-binding CsgD family transcriptional regulator